MIEKHIVNIGYPRSGTSWLWHNANFEPRDDKENQILLSSLNFEQYTSYYNQFKVSANFQPNLWFVDTEIIKFVNQHATHTSLILRNPFDLVERYFDWIHKEQDVLPLTDFIVFSGMTNYYDVIKRWSNGAANFCIFFFEDLQQDPGKFLNEYLSFCDLPLPVAKSSTVDYNKKINANKKTKKVKLEFTKHQIEYINAQIEKVQTLIDRNILHWKK
jgi:hypothetical protein